MSVKTDAPTYPFSELLIKYINKELPEAQSKPARAKDFERVQSLFSTNQMPLVLLSKQNAKDLINGEGEFKEFGSTHSNRGIYECAEEWTARQRTTSGLVSYFKAYYSKYINTNP